MHDNQWRYGTRNGYNDTSCKRVPRNYDRNGGYYLNMDKREEEKFQLVLKSLPYEVKVWWNSKCENGRRIGDQPIKTWIRNHEEQKQVQPKLKFMESLMVEEFPKNKELSKEKIEQSLKIHVVDETSKE
ncbi:hypothetical protein M9H77_03294 [Catharanthus roseus]|uniref:Uncharacterized protein n=1 Tax=Catharanthus roseus TaxID=4058 RepID=A0ACC0CAW6_CATRO|nr:hypothetical protein M9H77_03294 [Catharanthus roseus]